MRFAALLTSVLFLNLTNVIVQVHCTVSITVHPAIGNVVECNSNITLTCSTPANTETMTWYRNKDDIAYCAAGYCFDVNTLPHFTATFNITNGKFDVAISPAIKNDSTAEFKCEDGIDSDRIVLIVTDDYSLDIALTTLPSNKTKIEFVTGCINTSTELQISWSLENVNNSEDVKPLTTEFTEVSNETLCSSDENCGGPGKKKHVSSVTVTEDNDQENAYYVKVRVRYIGYQDYDKVWKSSDRPFKVKGVEEDDKECDSVHRWVYGLVFGVIFLTTIAVTFIIKKFHSPDGKRLCKTWEMAFCTGISIFIIFGIVVIVTGRFIRCIDDVGLAIIPQWLIYLILCCATLLFCIVLIVVYVLKEPVHGLRIVSTQESLRRTLQWSCRLSKYKTFYIQLEHNGKIEPSKEVHCEVVDSKTGLMQYTLTGLRSGVEYKAFFNSKMCDVSSLIKEIQLDTKVPPQGVTDLWVVQKTDTSVTLRLELPQTPSSDTYPVSYVIECSRANTCNEAKRLYKTCNNLYTIKDLRPKTSYTISVYVENIFGTSDTSKPIVVKTKALKPLPPSEFQCIVTREEDVTLTWRPCLQIERQTFILSYQLNNEQVKKTIAYDDREIVDYSVTGLDPGTDYTFYLSTSIDRRTSKISRVISVTTKAIKPPYAFKCISTSEGDVTLTWVPSSNIERQGFQLVYSVNGSQRTKKVKYKSEDREVRCTVKNLEPGTEYVFELASVVGKGIFKNCSPVHVKTKELQPPSDFKCTEEDEESLTLSWKPSSKVRRQKFCLRYLLEGIAKEIMIEYEGKKRMEYTVQKLYPDTEYKFVLAALIGEKKSDFTSEMCAKTEVLKAPSNFTVTIVGKRDISLEWKPLSSVRRQEFCLTAIYEERKDVKRIRYDNTDIVKHTETSLKQDTDYIFVVFSAFNQKTSDLCSAFFINTTDMKLDNALVYSPGEKTLKEYEDQLVQLKAPGFRCKEVSEDDATLEWTSGSDTVGESFYMFCYNHSGAKAVISINKSSKERQHEYTLQDLDQDTEYKLNLVAVVDKKTYKHPAVLRIKTKKLEPPTEVHCVNVSETNVKLQWKHSSRKSTQKFKIIYKAGETNGEETIDYTGGSVIQHTVEHLEPGTLYMFELVTILGEKISQNVAKLCIETKELEPPTEFHSVNVGETNVKLQWKPSSRNPAQKFKISYKAGEANGEETIDYTEGSVIQHTVEHLEPGTLYMFELVTVVKEKMSQNVAKLCIETKELEPPSTFQYKVVRENDITLLWRPSSSNSNQQFKLTYKSDKGQDENMIKYTGSPVIEHLVTDLEPGTLYSFDLFTVVGDKVSKKASRQRVKTQDCSSIPTEEINVEE